MLIASAARCRSSATSGRCSRSSCAAPARSPAPTPARSTSSRAHDDDVAQRTLRFKVSQNDSVHDAAAGLHDGGVGVVDRRQCVLSGDRINVPDLYALDEPGTGNNPWGFVHDRTFDDKLPLPDPVDARRCR